MDTLIYTFTVKPRAGSKIKGREFVFETDEYGASITDTKSGLCVILDWDGEELKALVETEGNEPDIVTTLQP